MNSMSPTTFAALQERIEYLEADNTRLRDQLRLDPTTTFIAAAKSKLAIQPAVARMLWVLWDGRVKSREALFDALYGDKIDQPEIKILDVYVCKLRRSLAEIDAGLKTHWALGYQLLPADRAKIAAHIGIEVQP